MIKNKYQLNTILINKYKNFEHNWYVDCLNCNTCVIMPTCNANLSNLLEDYRTELMCKYLNKILDVKFLWLASFLVKKGI